MDNAQESARVHAFGDLWDPWPDLLQKYFEFLDKPHHGRVLDYGHLEKYLTPRLAEESNTVVQLADPTTAIPLLKPSRTFPPSNAVIFARLESLPFPAGRFDLVSTALWMCLTGKVGPRLRELVRVLKRGGAIGGIVPSRLMNRESVDATLQRMDPHSQARAVIDGLPDLFPDGFSENTLSEMLIASELKALRTVECLDGLLLLFKARL